MHTCECVCGKVCGEGERRKCVCVYRRVQYVGEYFQKVMQMLTFMNFRSGTLLSRTKSPCGTLLE